MFKEKVKPEAGAEEKFQTIQKVEPAAVAEKTDSKTPIEKPVVTKSTNNGSTLKQDKVAELLQPTLSGAPSVSGGAALRMVRPSSSGSTDSTLDKANATPVGRQSRPDSRFGKKVEKTATKLNYTVSEQYLKAYVESKPLAESADSVQGYNGTYRNETYRSQKIAGATPAELMFDRSLDFIVKDQIYFAQGQQVVPSGLAGSFDPAKVWDQDAFDWINNPNRITRGNFIPRAFHFRFGRDQYGTPILANFGISCDAANVTPRPENSGAMSSNTLTELNKIEVIRETMESKAGDESNKDWCPLPKAIEDSNGWLALLHAYEASLGSEVLMARTKFGLCSSFQLNRAAKDGQDTIRPATEAFLGGIVTHDDMTDYSDTFSDIFSQSYYELGSASAFIDAFDSKNKYHYKADILLQPRSLKMHYLTGLANSDEFYVDPRFVKTIAKTEAYSTYDRDYDPTLPVLMTDKAAISYPFDIAAVSNYSASFGALRHQSLTVDAYTGAEATTGFDAVFAGRNHSGSSVTLYYNNTGDGSNDGSFTVVTDATAKTVTLVANSTVNGADEETLVINDTEVADHQIVIPDGYSFYIEAPIDPTKVLFYYEGKCEPQGATDMTYAYSDIRNTYYVHVRHALFAGIVQFLEEHIAAFTKAGMFKFDKDYELPIYHSTKYWSFWDVLVLASTPYIQQARTNYMRDILHYSDAFGYPFTDLVKLGEVGEIPFENFSFRGFEQELGLGRISGQNALRWTMPEFFWYLGYDSSAQLYKYVAPWYVCEMNYRQGVGNYYVNLDCQVHKMCWPSTRAGIKQQQLVDLQSFDERQLRLGLDAIVDITNGKNSLFQYPRAYKYGQATDGQLVFSSADGLTIRQMLSMPRELGWLMDAPGGYLTAPIGQTVLDVSPDDNCNGASSFRIYSYTNPSTTAEKNILSTDDININRAANFTQTWHMADVVSAAIYNVTGAAPADYGLIYGAGMAINDGSLVAGKTTFSPFAALATGVHDNASNLYPDLIAMHRYYYTRLQQLPFIVSPFDAVDLIDGGSSHFDIYDMSYIFGLCGFRASDFSEDIYNRETECFNKGMLFTSDPWYEDSYLSK